MRRITTLTLGILLATSAVRAAAPSLSVSGAVLDPQGRAVPGAVVRLVRKADASRRQDLTDAAGHFSAEALEPGEYRLTAEAEGFAPITRTVQLSPNTPDVETVQFSGPAAREESITVSASVADAGVFSPDPAQRVLVPDQTLDANPGRPGMPVSIPGMPVESPAGGVKPPQYFAPGVAGDHGEPIAMFFQVGGYLFPNNLPANAHGNGYADPNVVIPVAIESIETDGAAFNVREGNNAVNAGITFGLRDRLEPMLRLTTDYRDVNLVAAWSPRNPAGKMWAGLELSYGNGFLRRLEHRRQYKANVSKVWTFGRHELTTYGIGYYGFAFQPGLIPIGAPVPGDTYDARQNEATANGALIVNDIWHWTARRQLQFSGFYRYYTLDVRPNFGDGLIRQSEHRTARAGNVLYAENYSQALTLLAGADFRRDAPRDLDLDRADAAGVFHALTANDVTIDFASPFVALDGTLRHGFHYEAGYRRDEVAFENRDLYRPELSFRRRASINSPKATLSWTPRDQAGFLPGVALSYGQAFHVNDPRIGLAGEPGGTIVSKARAYQLVASKTVAATEFRVTLAHVTTAQQLARISNDTGLQQDVGPGLVKSLSVTARRNFSGGFVQAWWARADARDRLTGAATPEAPRLIWGVLGSLDHLPFHLLARGEYEHIGRKPLGDGFLAVPVREFRGALVRPFVKQGVDVGVNFFVASGYGGQTLETLALPGEGQPFERIAGFPLRSYVTASVTYHFRRSH